MSTVPAQLTLDGQRHAAIDGSTYEPHRDGHRLTTLLERVEAYMRDQEWRTLRQIADKCGGSEASVSARLRDLRKPKFGGHTVERLYIGDGKYLYRVRP